MMAVTKAVNLAELKVAWKVVLLAGKTAVR